MRKIVGGMALTFQRVEAPSWVHRRREVSAVNIEDVAERSGVPAKRICYCEDIGLVRPLRSGNVYRHLATEDPHKLAFPRLARSPSFGIDGCRALVPLRDDRKRSSSDIETIAQKHLSRIGRKISELQSSSGTGHDIVVRCHSDDCPDCPIADDLARAGTG